MTHPDNLHPIFCAYLNRCSHTTANESAIFCCHMMLYDFSLYWAEKFWIWSVDLKIAMEDVATFRVNALPQMANTIIELDKISADAEKTITKIEKGNRARPQIKIDIES